MGKYDTYEIKEIKPSADILMTSMRSMGYSFETAVADIVDNSISAEATRIDIKFPAGPDSIYVAICDNGFGMTSEELIEAMRYGSALKRENRNENDLGRFGLGLKSASLSQCRKLTVLTKKNSVMSACIWDLDLIDETENWNLIICPPEAIPNISFSNYLMDIESGTVVLWEDFDILRSVSGNEYSALMNYMNVTAEYLSLVYHRYLNRKTSSRLIIKVNNYQLEGYDPFLENHPKTTIKREFSVQIQDTKGIERSVTVQPYVLPFQKDLSDEDKKRSGGIENYRTKQGFYIYRNERLIVWGTWFGRRKDELTKYARIRVDFPNTLDEIWGIDIMKHKASIPPSIKQRLTRAVDEAMDVAIAKQKYRGRIVKADEAIDYIWSRTENRGDITYSINRDSLIFQVIKNKVDDETWGLIDILLEEIEKSIPFQQIYIDGSQGGITETLDDERKAEIVQLANIILKSNTNEPSLTNENAVDLLMGHEPFCKYPELKQILLGEGK